MSKRLSKLKGLLRNSKRESQYHHRSLVSQKRLNKGRTLALGLSLGTVLLGTYLTGPRLTADTPSLKTGQIKTEGDVAKGLGKEETQSAATPSSEQGEITHVRMWLGREPKSGRSGVGIGNLRRFVLKDLKIAEVEAYDIQYRQKNTYRGINLRDLIGVMSPLPPAVDMVILHTHNGILIPVAIKDLTEDREIFLATALKGTGKLGSNPKTNGSSAGDEEILWTRNFPEVKMPGGNFVHFLGNKLIAGEQYQNKNPKSFNVWDFAGSLEAVELVESRSYYRSINRRDGKNTSLGHTIFQGRCWYCHNVRGVGGHFGPDLTKIPDIKDIKGIQKLFLRVSGPKKKKDPKLQHAMPYQEDFTFKEAKSLWFWLKETRTGELAPYEPSYQKSVRWED